MIRKLSLVFLLLSLSVVAIAQPASAADERRLKTDLRNLDRRFDTLSKLGTTTVNSNNENRVRRAIVAAEKELAEFKTDHPKYDVAKYEKQLSDFTSAQTSALETKEGELANIEALTATVEELFDFRPDIGGFISQKDNIVVLTETRLKEYPELMNAKLTADFLSPTKDSANRDIRNLAAKASRNAEIDTRRLGEINLAEVKEIEVVHQLLAKFYDVLYARERLGLLKRIFPDVAEIGTAYNKASALAADFGSPAEIKEIARKNRARAVARVRMRPEVQQNAALKAEFTRVFTKGFMSPESLIGGTLLQSRLVNSSWGIERNELTGIILNRYQTAQFAVKAADGRCFLYTFLMKQNYNGSSYGGGIPDGSSETEMLCENVPK